jgi:hypothetical protein
MDGILTVIASAMYGSPTVERGLSRVLVHQGVVDAVGRRCR